MTVQSLSTRTGFSSALLSSWLDEEDLPSVDELAVLAGTLEVEPAALIRPVDPRGVP